MQDYLHEIIVFNFNIYHLINFSIQNATFYLLKASYINISEINNHKLWYYRRKECKLKKNLLWVHSIISSSIEFYF